MSSRAEEKERRRQERLALEQSEHKAAARQRRLQLALGAVLAVAAIVGVVVAVASKSGGGGSGPATGDASASVKLPVRQETDLTKAAKAAGCVVKSFPLEGRDHTTAKMKYLTNPPTSGNHNPNPSEDGFYPNGAPPKERNVHALEHGRIEIQYRPGTPKNVTDTLEAIFNEPLKGKSGYHQLLFANNTNMPFEVAVASWQHYLGCNTWNPKAVDAIRAFREQYVDKGPEFIP